MFQDFAYLIILLPIIAFVLTLFFGKKLPANGGILSILAVFSAFVISAGILIEIYPSGCVEQSWPWFAILNFGILIDPLAAVMLCMVSLVSFLIHVYSVGYMAHDRAKPRYFAETALFTTAMLGVALSDNILQFFIFWELVGLCSYLLIGFWYRKPTAAAAAKKAFLVTRVGDVLFLAGIIVLYLNIRNFQIPDGTYLLQFQTMFAAIGHIPPSQLTVITLLFFGGAIGKSGQFPLHIWLPDAMEGPTTVSALIHAATMVTAGVYLVARTFPIFLASPDALTVVAYIGGFTAIFAATMGLVMNDIKRVLAYSTVSQLGYMMLALGTGIVIGAEVVGVSMFHLINHAFFKALLFLCAGSVIHGLGCQDLRQMGGAFSKMKITAITMLIAALSLSGIPPTAGFFSKDPIIEGAYAYLVHTGDMIPFAFSIIAALLTSIYIFRLWFMTFTGKPRTDYHAHESPPSMTVPLIILAILALLFGLVAHGAFGGFLEHTYSEHLIEDAAAIGGHHLATEHVHPPTILFYMPIIVGVLGFVISWLIYNKRVINMSSIVSKRNPIYTLLLNRYYQQKIYIEFIAITIVYRVLAMLGEFIDRRIIDGIIDGISYVIITIGEFIRRIQTGVVQHYAAFVVAGVVVLILLLQGGIL
ncbi:MAG: F(420)H(2) dehydrogenase subunit L [Candidatus Argoarchaeum ethanivorans]|uniref:F(420)H(2) dehydrogenase subunit L n=1 Tax=Candidatus Argoarchaeum ethanivorans TaxID=2608793 RepID=A0A811T9L0_9EURY|nr:MAG: F(420)H(2) dehydrogenase subunit L [Candidatus Argoarchaeum ethanivorans]